MFIKRTTDIQDVIRLVPIEVRLREKEKSPIKAQELLAFVQSQLNNPLFYAVIVYDDETEKNIMGYIMLLVIPFKLMDMQHVNILRVYYDPKYRNTEIKEVGWQIAEAIAREHGIKKVRIEVKRGEKAYQRTWGFKRKSIVMERRV
jgi:hypothetical protein